MSARWVKSLINSKARDSFELLNNPVLSGNAGIRLNLAAADHVDVRIYDLTGRLVRRLAARRFEAGEHLLKWDGLDDRGRRAPRGLYFTRVRYWDRRFEADKKLTLVR